MSFRFLKRRRAYTIIQMRSGTGSVVIKVSLSRRADWYLLRGLFPFRHEVFVSHRRSTASLGAALVLFLALPLRPASAVTVAEALAAEATLGKVDAMSPEDRAAFIRDNRAQLNQALMTEQVLGTIRQTVQITALASERLYHRPLLCGIIADEEQGDDDTEVGSRPPLPPPAPLPEMVAAFNAEMKTALHLPDGAATEARLAQMDVTDIIVNRMISDNRCQGKKAKK
jgi:hypothetical protein